MRVVAGDEAAEMDHIEGAAVVALDGLREHIERIGPAERSRLVAVVASQGHYDESALETILRGEPAFVGSAREPQARRAASSASSRSRASPDAWLDTIRNPVGLDIGARKPVDVAVSVLAEIIAETSRRSDEHRAIAGAPAPALVDPVCGMDVDAGPRHREQAFRGGRYFFCCAHCRATFVRRTGAISGCALGTT